MPVETRHVESELGRWTTTTWAPPAGGALAPYVLGIWDFDGVLAQRRERVFPNGSLELIVQLDEPHRPGDRSASAHFPALCIGGMPTASAVVEAPAARCRVLGVRLRPVAMFALTGVAQRELRDLTVDLRDAVGRDAGVLGERCHGARDGAERVRVAAAWVARRVLRARHVDARVAWAAATIDARDGAVSIGALEEAVGRRRLSDGFRTHVGVSPKRLARIARFRRGLAMVVAGAPLADVALAGGFYDQAHFTAEFRAHAGMTPTAFLRARRFPNATSLAED
jgi:AraC-like DNA-binding protein